MRLTEFFVKSDPVSRREARLLEEAIQDALGLCDGELDRSWECLRRCGNLSSASVLLVLEDVMMAHRPAPGTLGVILAMGPGFCSEMILIRW